MRELNTLELGAVTGDNGSGGSGFSFGGGTVPGYGSQGSTDLQASYSFGNGWSVIGGSTRTGSDVGVGVRFVWK
ncbi:hypothetical protein [Paracoccus sp. S3-43]|uniref:hypothetical protein n=1 Tax=Paracoccus sp. S3-43 TaxID=3030011 RepID=UPI0023B19A86|nr:hypothetical protein [Paracoccus sp. S3-43]WEF24714.1 hypothetical protein PXD02_01760 [Paracoccus sp. S3-43]